MFLNAVPYLLLALATVQTLALDLSGSKIIWTNELSGGNAPVGSRAFRRVYNPIGDKTPFSASILIGVDDAYTLYVNGKVVGSAQNYAAAQGYCVRLSPTCNVFAVNATNLGNNPAWFIGAIQIQYTDNSVDTIVTDDSWRTITSLPAGFQQVGFDDAALTAATVLGSYGMAPWGRIPIPAAPAQPSLTNTNWIWTDETEGGAAPIGFRAFRKTFTLPANQTASSATIFIAYDDQFSLYVQGKIVGSGQDYTKPMKFQVDLQPGASQLTFAVYAGNVGGGPAGLAIAVGLNSDCGVFTSFVTDNTWKFSRTTPAGFEQPGFDDSAWPAAVVEGRWGIPTWGNLPIPTVVSPPSGPLPGAPAGL